MVEDQAASIESIGSGFDGSLPRKPSAAEDPTYQKRLATVAEFLKSFPVIRIGVEDAPGNGHQGVAALVMRRVRELGFSGRFEVVYPAEVKSKLDVTFPGFDPNGAEVQDIPALGATLIEQEHFAENAAYGLRIFGIRPAADSAQEPSDLKVHALLNIQPYRWDSVVEPSLQLAGRRGREPKTMPFFAQKSMPLVYDLPRPSDLGGFLEDEMGNSSRFQDKIPGLRVLLAAVGQRLDLLPVYGMSGAVNKLVALLRGIHHAQYDDPDATEPGPAVVLPLFSNFAGHEGRLRELLRKDPDLRGRVLETARIQDRDLEQRLQDLKPGQILPVAVGAVAPRVFDYIFAQATLPATVAGVNAQNLMRLIGRPYLSTEFQVDLAHADRAFIRGAEREAEGTALTVEEAYRALGEGPTERDSGYKIGEFIVAARDPASALSRAFRRYQVADPGQDKVLLTLSEAAKRMPRNVSWTAAPSAGAASSSAAPVRRWLTSLFRAVAPQAKVEAPQAGASRAR